jgi:sigma-B regulation protein RsbU (phosphoserine phosphatase)
LFMALFRSLLRAFAQQNVNRELVGLTQQGPAASDEQRLSDQLTVLNALYAVPLTNNYVAHTHSDAFMFVTLFFGVLNPKTGGLTYINAGHDAPVVLGPNGVKERLGTTGPVVGVLPEAEYDVARTTLEPGDTVFTYTDGVTEGKDINGALFSEERLLPLLTQPFSSSAELMDRVESNLIAYIGDAVQFDDITMMAVRRKPPPG